MHAVQTCSARYGLTLYRVAICILFFFMERKPLKGKANELENEGRARFRMQGRCIYGTIAYSFQFIHSVREQKALHGFRYCPTHIRTLVWDGIYSVV